MVICRQKVSNYTSDFYMLSENRAAADRSECEEEEEEEQSGAELLESLPAAATNI